MKRYGYEVVSVIFPNPESFAYILSKTKARTKKAKIVYLKDFYDFTIENFSLHPAALQINPGCYSNRCHQMPMRQYISLTLAEAQELAEHLTDGAYTFDYDTLTFEPIPFEPLPKGDAYDFFSEYFGFTITQHFITPNRKKVLLQITL